MIFEDPNPILRTPCKTVPFNRSSWIHKILKKEWKHYAKAHTDARVVGLAAPQVGQPYRLFMALDELYINPVIMSISQTSRPTVEGCCSLPDKVYQIPERRTSITICWCDITGKYHTHKFEDMMAVIIQHEMDHLDGKIISDIGDLIELPHELKAGSKATS